MSCMQYQCEDSELCVCGIHTHENKNNLDDLVEDYESIKENIGPSFENSGRTDKSVFDDNLELDELDKIESGMPGRIQQEIKNSKRLKRKTLISKAVHMKAANNCEDTSVDEGRSETRHEKVAFTDLLMKKIEQMRLFRKLRKAAGSEERARTCNSNNKSLESLEMCHTATVSDRNARTCCNNNKSVDACHKVRVSDRNTRNYRKNKSLDMCHEAPKLEQTTRNSTKNKGLDICHGAPELERNTNICSKNNRSLDMCHKATASEGRAGNYCEYKGFDECYTTEIHSRTGRDWRQQLLFLEMSHDLTDDVANKMNESADDDTTDLCDTPTDVVNSYEMKDVALERGEKVNAKKRSAADALGVCRDKKNMKKCKSNYTARVCEDKKKIKKSKSNSTAGVCKDKKKMKKWKSNYTAGVCKDKKKMKKCKSNFTANRETPNIRKSAGSKLEETTVRDDAANCCAELELTTLCGSSAKENFDPSTISVTDFALPLNMSGNTSTPCVKPKGKRKRKYNRKVNFKRKEDSSSATTNLVSLTTDGSMRDLSLLNLSLPTPRPPRVAQVSPKSVSYDANIDKDMAGSSSDSDEDLPVGLAPIKIEKSFSENDIVWVKWKKWVHIPALIRKVYKKKKRLTCVAFGPTGPMEDFTMGYGNPGSVLSFCDPKKDEILASAGQMDEESRKFFNACVTHAENFVAREALKGLGDAGLFKDKFDEAENQSKPSSDCSDENKLEETPTSRKRKQGMNNSECIIPKVEKPKHGLSKQGQRRIEKMTEKTKPLTEFLISDTTKEYLAKIYRGDIPSELHSRFLSGTVRERAKMKHRGFGPIDCEKQIEKLLETFVKWISEINKKPIHEIHYVFDVWVPEAVVFCLKKKKGYSWKKAWEQFNKGVRRTKEELRIIHEEMIDTDEASAKKDASTKPKELFLQ